MKKIIVLGKSKKFIKIIKELYINYEIQNFSWREIDKIRNLRLSSKINIIFVCGYDYNSQWYSYNKFYRTNISSPYKFISSIAKKNTFLFYVDTIDKIKKNSNSKTLILSRYEYAKKMLRYKLIKRFNKIQIIELPPIIDENSNVNIFGNRLTKIIFRILIFIKLIDSIELTKIKKKFLIKNNFNKKYTLSKPISLFLFIPRPLFIDRFLRIISG